MTNQVIPAEAVEAAAKAAESTWNTWGNWEDVAQAALEAAAPYMLAAAWDEGHEEGWLNHESGLTESKGRKRNPYMLNTEGEK